MHSEPEQTEGVSVSKACLSDTASELGKPESDKGSTVPEGTDDSEDAKGLEIVGHAVKMVMTEDTSTDQNCGLKNGDDTADEKEMFTGENSGGGGEDKADEGKEPSGELELLQREVIAIQFASIQITALKAVQCILSSQKYGEMLLVPKSDLVANSSKALADGTVVRKDENFKNVICGFMKKLIVIAASSSPFKRIIEIDELDRTRGMLMKKAVERQAEEKTNLSKLRGKSLLISMDK